MAWVGASDSVKTIDSPGQGFHRVCSVLKLKVDQARPADLPSHTGFSQQEAAWAQRPSVLQPEAGCPDPCPCLPTKTVQDSERGLLPPPLPGDNLAWCWPSRGLVPCAWFPGLPAAFLASLLAGLPVVICHLACSSGPYTYPEPLSPLWSCRPLSKLSLLSAFLPVGLTPDVLGSPRDSSELGIPLPAWCLPLHS